MRQKIGYEQLMEIIVGRRSIRKFKGKVLRKKK